MLLGYTNPWFENLELSWKSGGNGMFELLCTLFTPKGLSWDNRPNFAAVLKA
jgi:hypothetical protein